jgi:hypothetical protein
MNRFLFILSRCPKILGERNVVGLKKSKRLVEEVSVLYVTTWMTYLSLEKVILRDSNILIRIQLVLEVGLHNLELNACDYPRCNANTFLQKPYRT